MMIHEAVSSTVSEALWLFLPLYVAAVMKPFLVTHPVSQRFDMRIDKGVQWRGAPVLGPRETWTGVIGSVLVAVFTTYFLRFYWSHPFSLQGTAFAAAVAFAGSLSAAFLKHRGNPDKEQFWSVVHAILFVVAASAAAVFVTDFSYDFFLVNAAVAPTAALLFTMFHTRFPVAAAT